MNGKEILIETLKGKKAERIPWVPFVGCHGASVLGVSAEDYLKSADMIVEGQLKAADMYKADGIPVVFDLQLEAEVLGCDLEWSAEGPPSVSSHPFEMGKSIADLPEYSLEKGRFPTVLEATRRMKEAIGDSTALYGLICGPFTLALHLYGNNIFLEMFDNEEGVKETLDFCAEVARKTIDGYLDNGCDVIAVVDPMTSQISPEHFDEFVAPYVNNIFDYIRDKGGYSSLFVCGDATRNLENMCQTTCDSLSVDENISLEYLAELAGKYKKVYGGNLQLTVTLLLGSPDACKKDAIKCMDIGEGGSFILAPGCDLPFAVPSENLQAVAEVVHDSYQREIARKMVITENTEDTFDDVEIPDYKNCETVIVDMITLDSKTCAPCQYTVSAVKDAAEEIGDGVIWREHKVTGRDGLGYMTKLGITNIPTICINGKAEFVSLIPDHEKLVKTIRAKMQEA